MYSFCSCFEVSHTTHKRFLHSFPNTSFYLLRHLQPFNFAESETLQKIGKSTDDAFVLTLSKTTAFQPGTKKFSGLSDRTLSTYYVHYINKKRWVNESVKDNRLQQRLSLNACLKKDGNLQCR